MKSNKERYKRHIQKHKGNSGQADGNAAMWFIIFVIIFSMLFSVYAYWNGGVLGKWDISAGTSRGDDHDLMR